MRDVQARQTHGEGFLLRWWLWVTLAVSIGFLAPAAVGASVALPHAELSLVSLTAAGVAEGAVLGYAQARVPSRHGPHGSPPEQRPQPAGLPRSPPARSRTAD